MTVLALTILVGAYLIALEDLKAVLRQRGQGERWRYWVFSELPDLTESLDTMDAHPHAMRACHGFPKGSAGIVYIYLRNGLSAAALERQLDDCLGLAPRGDWRSEPTRIRA